MPKKTIKLAKQLEELYHEHVSSEKGDVLGVPDEDLVEEDYTGEERGRKEAAETVESGIEAVPGYDMSWLLHEPPTPLSDEEFEKAIKELEAEERLVDAAFAEFSHE